MLMIPMILLLLSTMIASLGAGSQGVPIPRSTTAQICHQQANDRFKAVEERATRLVDVKAREDVDLEKRFQALEHAVGQITKTVETANYWLRLLLGAVALTLLDKAMSLFGWAWARYNGGSKHHKG